jgi:hypothetical protein
MYGLRASAEPQRQWPCGDAAWAVASAGANLGNILKSVSSHGAGRWCR